MSPYRHSTWWLVLKPGLRLQYKVFFKVCLIVDDLKFVPIHAFPFVYRSWSSNQPKGSYIWNQGWVHRSCWSTRTEHCKPLFLWIWRVQYHHFEELCVLHLQETWTVSSIIAHQLDESCRARQTKICQLLYRFTARVTAYNYFGHVSSDLLEIHVIEKLEPPLVITMEGDTVIGQKIEFEAYHYRGSDVTYTWDFGDGIVNVTNHIIIGHTYAK